MVGHGQQAGFSLALRSQPLSLRQMCDLPKLEAPRSVPGPFLVEAGNGGQDMTERRVEMGRKEGVSGPHLTLPVQSQFKPPPLVSQCARGLHKSQNGDTAAAQTTGKALGPPTRHPILTIAALLSPTTHTVNLLDALEIILGQFEVVRLHVLVEGCHDGTGVI